MSHVSSPSENENPFNDIINAASGAAAVAQRLPAITPRMSKPDATPINPFDDETWRVRPSYSPAPESLQTLRESRIGLLGKRRAETVSIIALGESDDPLSAQTTNEVAEDRTTHVKDTRAGKTQAGQTQARPAKEVIKMETGKTVKAASGGKAPGKVNTSPSPRALVRATPLDSHEHSPDASCPIAASHRNKSKLTSRSSQPKNDGTKPASRSSQPKPQPRVNPTTRPMTPYEAPPTPKPPQSAFEELSCEVHSVSRDLWLYHPRGKDLMTKLEVVRKQKQARLKSGQAGPVDPAEGHVRKQVGELVGRMEASREEVLKLQGKLEEWLVEQERMDLEGEGDGGKDGDGDGDNDGAGKTAGKRRWFWNRRKSGSKGKGDLQTGDERQNEVNEKGDAKAGDDNGYASCNDKDVSMTEGPTAQPHWIQRVVMGKMGWQTSE